MIDFAAGTVQTIAGSSCERATVANGTMTTAKFGDILRVGLVKQGSHQVLFLGQCAQGVIRTMNLTTGVVATLAGVFGMVDANGVDGPAGTGLLGSNCREFIDDGNGGAYFGNNNRIRHVDASGQLSTLALPPATASIVGIAKEGNRLFYQTGTTGTVFSFEVSTPTISATEFVGVRGYRDGMSGKAEFYESRGIEVTANELYIIDFWSIRRVWRH